MNQILCDYFDRPLSPDEREQLSSLLAEDPMAAREFARLAQKDAAMERHFASAAKVETADLVQKKIRDAKPSQRDRIRAFKPSRRTLLIGASIAAILAILGLVLPLLHSPSSPFSPKAAALQVGPYFPDPPHVPGAIKVNYGPDLDRDAKYAAAELRARLKRFHLPRLQILHLNLPGALAAIEKAIEKSDHRSWREDHSLELEAPETDEERTIELAARNISVLEALDLIAIQTGQILQFHPERVSFVPFEPDSEAPQFTQTFKNLFRERFHKFGPYADIDFYTIDLDIDPEVVEFSGFINYGSPISTASVNELGEPTVVELTNSRIENPVFSTRRVIPPSERLSNWGIQLSEDAQVSWEDHPVKPSSELEYVVELGSLTVTASREQMDRIATLARRTAESRQGALVAVRSKVLDVPTDYAHEGVMNQDELSDFSNSISASEAIIVSYPSVVTANAQSVVVQSTIEHQFPSEGDETIIDHEGTALHITAQLDGELVRLTGKLDFGFIPEDASQELPSARRLHPDSKVVHHEVDFDVYVAPNESAALTMPAPDSKRSFVFLLEATQQ